MKKPRYWDVWRAVRDTKRQFTNHQVQDALKESTLSGLQAVPLDRTYWGVSIETWKLILAYTGTDRKKYVKDSFDCDNFAVHLTDVSADKFEINGVGIVVDGSGGHAYCSLLIATKNGLSIATVEPQNDKFILKPEGMYQARAGFILLP